MERQSLVIKDIFAEHAGKLELKIMHIWLTNVILIEASMIVDKNKKITEIKYNQLNLPKKIIFGTGNTIEYIYNAAGQKLEKIVKEGFTTANTNYLGGFQYKDNILEFFPTAEGYVKNENNALSYVFQYKDHLGNIRLSYAKNPTTQVLEIIEENNYYPFGLKHKGYNDVLATNNKYKYNGKELQDELGLNMYDYGARNYDPALGRFMNIDPLAEKSRRFSPYVYALNNPVFFIDPDGMQAKPMDINFDTNSDNFKNAPQYLSSTVVDNNGKIIDHKDDGDDNIYLNKRGGEVVGKERDGVTYEKDKKIVQDDLTGNHFLFSNGIGKIENIKPVKPTYGIVFINPVALEVAIVEGFGLLMETVEGAIVFDSFAQRGNNNGKLQDDELQAIKARKEAGTASSSDLQKLKKHEKNTNQRSSRQSKDKK